VGRPHPEHTGNFQRLADIDVTNLGMGVFRDDELGKSAVGGQQIVDKRGATSEQPRILFT
jgi:hypothetical protein